MGCLTLAPGSDRILVELFQILKDDAVESAALNMQYVLNMQYAGSRHQGDRSQAGVRTEASWEPVEGLTGGEALDSQSTE